MVSASAITATVTTLLIGALSDKVGKRKLFICGGYIVWGVSIWSFALIRTDVIGALFPSVTSAAALGVSLTIIMDCVMTFFGSSANDACFNAWLTDATDETNRGLAEGLNAMMPLVAILAVFGGFMGVDQSTVEGWTLIFTAIGVVVTVLGIAGFFLIKEHTVAREENSHFFANIFYGFRPSVIRSNLPLYGTLILLALFNISIQIFMPYLILYYTESLGFVDYVLIFAPAIAASALFTGLYGKVYDRKGFRFAIIPTLALLTLGYIGLIFVRTKLPVFLFSLLMMCGFLGTGAMLGARIRDCTPEGKAGMFQGLRIIGQVLIPGVVGPAIGAWLLRNADTMINTDGTTSFIPNESIFLGALVAAVVVWLALIPLFRKKKGE